MMSDLPPLHTARIPALRECLLRLCTVCALVSFAGGLGAQDQGRGVTPSQLPSQGGVPGQGPEVFDPSEGMDENGRIPKPEIPDDIAHPQRWRYIPEGRIAPGSIFDRFGSTTFISPIIFSESDIGFGGGIALTDTDFRNQRRQEFANILLSYTTEGQQRFSIKWRRWTDHRNLEEGGVLQSERAYWAGNIGYERTLTRRFFGLGSDTKPSDETSYTDQVGTFGLSRQFAFPEAAGDWLARLGLSMETHQLSDGAVSGIPSTGDVYPGLVAAGDGRTLVWLEGGLAWNTRDSLSNPYSGSSIGLGINAAPLQSEGESGALFRLGGSQVFSIPALLHGGGDGNEENPPTDALAFSAFMTSTAGDLPFYSLPTLGGSRTLRGYIRNRWTDRAAWHASGEYRFWFVPRGFKITNRIRIERIGAALFYDMGSVADKIGDFGTAGILDSYGIGLRVGIERTAIFRLDFGFSDEGSNVILTFGLPF